MGKRHNTLSDEIFRNSKYINTLEQALEIADFKKEYKTQYEMMFDVFKTLIAINNVLFADSNKNIKEKQEEIQDILFNILYKNSDSERLKYGLRLQKELKDSHTRYLYNRFIEWYNTFYTYSFETLKNNVEKEMTKLENIGFDSVVKGGISYEKNKNSNYKIYTSKIDYLYPNVKEGWKEFIDDFYDTYGIKLSRQEIDDIYFIYKLIAYGNNGIVKLLFQDEVKVFELTVKDNAENYFKAYLTSLNIDIKDNTEFMKKANDFLNELFITKNVIVEQLENNTKNKHIIEIANLDTDVFIANHDLYFFYVNMEKITTGLYEFTIKADVILKLINDLKEIYNLMYDNVPIIINEKQVQEAFTKLQNIIDRNKKMFERLS